MATLSEQTVLKIREVIQAILAEPEFYDQDTFPHPSDCGATCCAAGWAVWLDNPERYKRLVKERCLNDLWEFKAKEVLGLPQVSIDLFSTYENWPNEFNDMYYFAETPQERAQAMAARWEDFIQTYEEKQS